MFKLHQNVVNAKVSRCSVWVDDDNDGDGAHAFFLFLPNSITIDLLKRAFRWLTGQSVSSVPRSAVSPSFIPLSLCSSTLSFSAWPSSSTLIMAVIQLSGQSICKCLRCLLLLLLNKHSREHHHHNHPPHHHRYLRKYWLLQRNSVITFSGSRISQTGHVLPVK